MAFYTNAAGKILTNSAGQPLDCDHCPCDDTPEPIGCEICRLFDFTTADSSTIDWPTIPPLEPGVEVHYICGVIVPSGAPVPGVPAGWNQLVTQQFPNVIGETDYHRLIILERTETTPPTGSTNLGLGSDALTWMFAICLPGLLPYFAENSGTSKGMTSDPAGEFQSLPWGTSGAMAELAVGAVVGTEAIAWNTDMSAILDFSVSGTVNGVDCVSCCFYGGCDNLFPTVNKTHTSAADVGFVCSSIETGRRS